MSEVLAKTLGEKLLKSQVMLSTAESCTGGLLASTIIDVAGSSQWFERGFVCYTNQSKIDELGVCAETLSQHGAVSEQTAMEMARGVLEQLKRHPAYIGEKEQWAVSTTGIAGPSGGSVEKPVGTVCFGLARLRCGEIEDMAVETVFLKGNRTEIRQQAVVHVLNMLLKQLT